MRTRFMHTSDWQLGVTRQFLDTDSQALWAAARFDSVRTLGQIAVREKCEFIVVAGDIFETNQVDRRTVLKACEIMAGIPLPIYLLPANHDPLDAGSVFTGRTWLEHKPAQVHVLNATGQPLEVRPGVEVVGAPWTSKRPLVDLVAAAAAKLEPAHGALRVMVGHGSVDSLSPDRDNPAVNSLANVRHPSFLRLLRQIVDAVHDGGRWVGHPLRLDHADRGAGRLRMDRGGPVQSAELGFRERRHRIHQRR